MPSNDISRAMPALFKGGPSCNLVAHQTGIDSSKGNFLTSVPEGPSGDLVSLQAVHALQKS